MNNSMPQDSNNLPVQDQLDDSPVYQSSTSRATVIYDDPSVDVNDLAEEEVVTESDELPPLDDLELTTEDSDQPTQAFSEQFQEHFGMSVEEARDLITTLQQEVAARQVNAQKFELSAAWNVPIGEVEQRLAVVSRMWSQLPDDKKAAYDNPKGAMALYERYTQQRGLKGIQSSSKQPAVQSKYLYTQKQIDQMDQATYEREQKRIFLAYAQGKVKK